MTGCGADERNAMQHNEGRLTNRGPAFPKWIDKEAAGPPIERESGPIELSPGPQLLLYSFSKEDFNQ